MVAERVVAWGVNGGGLGRGDQRCERLHRLCAVGVAARRRPPCAAPHARRRDRRRRDRLGSRRRAHRRARARGDRRGRAPRRARGSASTAGPRSRSAPSARVACAAPRCSRPRSRAGSASRACSCRDRRSATTATAATKCSPSRARPGDDFLAEVCVAWEAETQPAADAGVRTVLTRTGIVLDAGGGVLARMLLPFKLGHRRPSGLGAAVDELDHARRRGRRDPPRDRCTTSVRGPVNLVAPNPVTNADFARTLGHVLHRPTIFPTPMLPLKLRFGAELVESLLLASQRVDARAARERRATSSLALHSTLRSAPFSGLDRVLT